MVVVICGGVHLNVVIGFAVKDDLPTGRIAGFGIFGANAQLSRALLVVLLGTAAGNFLFGCRLIQSEE